MTDMEKLPNIGSVLAGILADASIMSYQDLVTIGSVEAMLRIRESVEPAACYNMLYALEGANRGVRWHAIPKNERQQLKAAFDEAVSTRRTR